MEYEQVAVGGGEQPVEELEAGQLIKDGLEFIPYKDMRLGKQQKKFFVQLKRRLLQ